MRKATFVRKYYGHGYDAHMVYLDYMYRDHELRWRRTYFRAIDLSRGNTVTSKVG